MSKSVTLSISIGTPNAEDHVSIEIDTDPCGENMTGLGKTSDFTYGDKVALLIWKSEELELHSTYHTWDDIDTATITPGSPTSRDHEETFTFGNGTKTATLSKPISQPDSFSYEWDGAAPKFVPIKDKPEEEAVVTYDEDSRTVECSLKGPELKTKLGVAKVSYSSAPTYYFFNIPTKDELKVGGVQRTEVHMLFVFKTADEKDCPETT